MSVSIVIPAYNAEAYLGRAVESVIAQSFTDWELIIVDDGSTDNTAEIARGYAATDTRIRVIHQANSGTCGGARNAALPLARADALYQAFLDADDLWYPDTLACLKRAVESDPKCVGAHGLARYIDPEDRETTSEDLDLWTRDCWTVHNGRLAPARRRTHTTYAMFALQNCIATPGAVMVRRSALEQAGPFDGRYSPADDWQMWIRLARLGSFVFVDRPVVMYRLHPGSMSRNLGLMNETVETVRREVIQHEMRNGDTLGLAIAAQIHTLRTASRRRLSWAKHALLNGHPVACAKHLRHAVIAYGSSLRSTLQGHTAAMDG